MRLQPCGAECAITLLPPFREQLHPCLREHLELRAQLPAQEIDYFRLDQITPKYRPSPPHSWSRPLHIFQKTQSLNHPILLNDNTPSSRASRMLSPTKSVENLPPFIYPKMVRARDQRAGISTCRRASQHALGRSCVSVSEQAKPQTLRAFDPMPPLPHPGTWEVGPY